MTTPACQEPHSEVGRSQARISERSKKVWIDLDNSPHVPFFLPIIRELEGRGYSIVLTSRDAFQVKELVDLHGLNCKCIGHHYGKNKLMKLVGILIRAIQLAPAILSSRPNLAVAHGSRAQLVLSAVLRIPTLHIGDYEYAVGWALIHPTWVMAPEVIPDEQLQRKEPINRILRYPGIKEDVYVPDFVPDPDFRAQLGLCAEDIVVTVRPPASEAHYHNPKSDELFEATIAFLGKDSRVKIVCLPRNQRQAELIRRNWPELFKDDRIVIPEHAVDGLNLIWFSDLVISGGGTMNREAAALGVPVYSIFRGKTGAVDKHLSETGRLVMIEMPEDLQKVELKQRRRPASMDQSRRPALKVIVDHITNIVEERRA